MRPTRPLRGRVRRGAGLLLVGAAAAAGGCQVDDRRVDVVDAPALPGAAATPGGRMAGGSSADGSVASETPSLAPTACDPAYPQAPRDGLSPCPVGLGCDLTAGCVARATEGSQYAPCQRSVDCPPGLFCGIDDFAGACQQYCSTDADCPGERCAPFQPPTFAGPQQLGLCVAVCNPVDPAASGGGFGACPAGFGCIDAKDGLSACIVGGTRQLYERCTGQECVPGLLCGYDELAFCKPVCFSDADCGGGRCRFATYRAGDTPVGFCSEICDPVDPQSSRAPFSACPEGYNCMPQVEGLSLCSLRLGNSGLGAPCNTFADCNAGLICDTDRAQCTELCHTDADCEQGSCSVLLRPAVFAADRELRVCSR